MTKRPLLLLLSALAFALATATQAAPLDTSAAPQTQNALKPLPQQSKAAFLTAEVLTRYHYKPAPFDDSMSVKIFDQYLKSIDPEKLFFLQSDIDHFSALRTTLVDSIVKEDLSAPYAIFNRYTLRVNERYGYARGLLKSGFDFEQKETFRFEREKEPWPKSEASMHEAWRKRVKNDWLRLKLAGKDDKSIAETLDKRYEHFIRRNAQVKSEDVFQIFMNAYTMAIEPHTNYLGPRAAEEFDISMKLSLVGIGAVLADKDDRVTIRELVPGGPAALSGKLEVGDRIVGVAQGERGVSTEILGWRLDDAVALIRGAADSIVVLDILPAGTGPDGKHRRVSLVRKSIVLEEQAAKKSVLTTSDGGVSRRIGVISLPSFYDDFEGRKKGSGNFKSASRDVARLLGELKQDKVDAVLIDLRNNGGGSLNQAVELTGLFVGNGPVVQQRDARGAVTVLGNSHSEIAWKGPLGVLINRASASASEIFAAAIQDYGRGWVIGETSFGKGTVQTVLGLDQATGKSTRQLGELKFTIAQFFRVNGSSTQLRGVIPDFRFPSTSDVEAFGESSMDNALPWMEVKPADYSPIGRLKSIEPVLHVRNETREKTDKDFLCLKDGIAEFKKLYAKREVTLNEAERRRERDAQEARQASCDSSAANGKAPHEQGTAQGAMAGRAARKIGDDGLQPDERQLTAELAEEKARKAAKDVFLNEAAHILGDAVTELTTHGDLANKPAIGWPADG